MKVFVTGNIEKASFYPILEKIIYITKKYNHIIYIDSKIDYDCEKIEFKSVTKDRVDVVFSIGGDGSLLSAIRSMNENQIPILGIHIGNLGFLNQINHIDLETNLNTFFESGSCSYKAYNLLSAELNYAKDNVKEKILALNDIVINHGNLLRLIKLKVDLNDELLNEYSCDGLIFSSPLGSTAYSLSAGGPIVSPDLDSIIVTPVSPHSLSARPIVLEGNSKLKISMDEKVNNLNVTADGQYTREINENYIITLEKSHIKAKFIFFSGIDNYYSKLRNKLNWFGKN